MSDTIRPDTMAGVVQHMFVRTPLMSNVQDNVAA
jgi:hypothetical protein